MLVRMKWCYYEQKWGQSVAILTFSPKFLLLYFLLLFKKLVIHPLIAQKVVKNVQVPIQTCFKKSRKIDHCLPSQNRVWSSSEMGLFRGIDTLPFKWYSYFVPGIFLLCFGHQFIPPFFYLDRDFTGKFGLFGPLLIINLLLEF